MGQVSRSKCLYSSQLQRVNGLRHKYRFAWQCRNFQVCETDEASKLWNIAFNTTSGRKDELADNIVDGSTRVDTRSMVGSHNVVMEVGPEPPADPSPNIV